MTYRRILFWLLFLLVVLLPANSVATELAEVSLQLKWTHQFQFAGYYAAIEKGFYRDAGLKVSLSEKTPGTNAIERVLSGQADFGVGGTHMITERLNGKPLIALAAIFQHSPTVVFALKESQINTPTDFVGRKGMHYSVGGVVIPSMLLREGIDPDSVEWSHSSRDLDDLIEGRTDLYTGYLTDTAYSLRQNGVEFTTINPLNYGVDFYGDLLYTTENQLRDHPARVKAFLDASIRGWEYALQNQGEIIDLILQKYAPRLEKEKLQFEAAESNKLIRSDVTPVGHLSSDRMHKMAALIRDLGQTDSLELFEGFIYDPHSEKNITAREVAWLQRRETVKLVVWDVPPLVSLSDGKVEGLVIDYLSELTNRYGVQFEYVQTTLPDALLQLEEKSGVVDAIPILRHSTEREEKVLFSDPYLSMEMGLYVKENNHSVTGIEDLVGKKVAVPQGYLLFFKLKNEFPGIQIAQVEGVREGLKALSSGEVDAYIGNVFFASYAAKELGLANIKIASPVTLLDPKHSLVVRDDWPELVSLFNRILADLSPEEVSEFRRRWLSIRYEYGITQRTVLRWGVLGGVVLLAIALLFSLWTRSLKKEVQRRKTTETALVNSVNQYQQLIQALPHGILEVDREFAISYCSQPFSNLLGYQPTELLGQNIYELLDDGDHKARLRNMFGLLKEAHTHQSLQLRLLSKENESCLVQFDCDFVESEDSGGQIVVVTDLQQQEKVEKQLTSKERQFQKTFEHIQVGIAHVNESGQFFWVNPFLCDLLGYTEQELLQRSFLDITSPEDKPLSQKMFTELKSGELGKVTYIKRYVRKDGAFVWAMISIVLLDEQEQAYYVGVIQDITELKQKQFEVENKSSNFEQLIDERTSELQNRIAEVEQLNLAMLNLTEDLQLSYSQLQDQSDEVKDVNQELESFAYSVSHDLRAPLRHVQGFAEILADSAAGELSDKNLSYLNTILSSADRMGRLIDELLAFSRAGRSELTYRTVDTAKVVAEIITQLEREVPERNIDWNIGELPSVNGDLAALRQVFDNLINNALKYSAPRAESKIEISCELVDEESVFRITDNGVGFDPAYKDKLFAVFSRLHRADQFEGTGIGLANIKRVVKRHGGRVWADSDGETGAQFCFSLPVKEGKGHD